MKRTRLAPVSKKRKAENVERRAVMHAAFGRYPRCAVCPILGEHGVRTGCDGRASDVHEPFTRARGGSITDPANALPTCRKGHTWLHTHPAQATAWGLLRDHPNTEET